MIEPLISWLIRSRVLNGLANVLERCLGCKQDGLFIDEPNKGFTVLSDLVAPCFTFIGTLGQESRAVVVGGNTDQGHRGSKVGRELLSGRWNGVWMMGRGDGGTDG